MGDLSQELKATQKERDLYRRLLELGAQEDPEPFLSEALSLIVEVTAAHRGYLALYRDDDSFSPHWWIAKGFSQEELKVVRQKISSGIIAEAMATGSLIRTEEAYNDPRFEGQESVQLNQIPSVLCAPVGRAVPVGVLYLQRRLGDDSFSEEDGARTLFFARHLSPFVERLTLKDKEASDPTQPFRQRLRLERLIGRSRALAELFSQVESAARFSVPVLLTGPSGTGKNLFAQSIHENSPRSKGPFIEVNCAALPENLFESELFGAVPGAHSTANKRIEGKIAAAQNGTLLLDEIGELPLSVQSKLLQFLQSKTYFPLGSSKPEKSNVRLIAATNSDLEGAISKKAFREDLFYRLNVLQIRIPSLQERRDDIIPLAKYFCEGACRGYDMPVLQLSLRGALALGEADWPGNIRQLGHVVEAAAIRAAMEGAKEVEFRHLFPEAAKEESAAELSFQEATRGFQKKLLLGVLAAQNWNVADTARRLSLTRTHVYHLINVFDLRRE